MERPPLSTSEILAVERTKLANERTFLAIFRSFVVLFSSGMAIIKIESLYHIENLGYFFIASSFMLFGFGLFRYLRTRSRLRDLLDS